MRRNMSPTGRKSHTMQRCIDKADAALVYSDLYTTMQLKTAIIKLNCCLPLITEARFYAYRRIFTDGNIESDLIMSIPVLMLNRPSII